MAGTKVLIYGDANGNVWSGYTTDNAIYDPQAYGRWGVIPDILMPVNANIDIWNSPNKGDSTGVVTCEGKIMWTKLTSYRSIYDNTDK